MDKFNIKKKLIEDKNKNISLLEFNTVKTESKFPKSKFMCRIHNEEFVDYYHHIIQDRNISCIGCKSERKLKYITERQSELDKLEFYNIEYLEDLGLNTGKYLCKDHNVIFEQRHNGIVNFNKSPSCKECRKLTNSSSYFERKSYNILELLNLKYKKEFYVKSEIFSSGHGKRFDLYLEEYNTMIEIDGRQHFPNEVSRYTSECTIFPRENDIEKNEYCKKNSIKLIRLQCKLLKTLTDSQYAFILYNLITHEKNSIFLGEYEFMKDYRYISDLTKFKTDYPEWPGITISLEETLRQIIQFELTTSNLVY